MILAGDIGGTKVNLALSSQVEQIHVINTFESRNYDNLENIITDFLSENQAVIDAACFAVAGPVIAGVAEITNLKWKIEARNLMHLLGISSVSLINDVESVALATLILKPDELFTINLGRPQQKGNYAIIAPGTGLGEAAVIFDSCKKYMVLATEGGHANFAPGSELEIQLLQYLLKKYDHVSVERVLSGPGLSNIYSFLRDSGYAEEPAWLKDELAQGDANAIIASNGLSKKSELCAKALEIFIEILGAEAGNMALKIMSLGGIFLGGGIVPKILPAFQELTFMNAFKNKGRFSSLLEQIPIHVILNDTAAVLGAAYFASRIND